MEFESKKIGKLIAVVSLVIMAIGTIVCGINSMRKYDYAVMFSENAVATLQEIKTGKWEVINTRWAMDARGVWNYEFIVRRHAPIFNFGKKKAAPAPAPRAVAPQQQAAPKQEAPAEAPKQ